MAGIYGLNVGVQAYADGRWTEAAELYTHARENCLRAGDRQNAALAGTNLGELLVSQGRLDEAERVLTDARRVLRSSGYTAFALFAEVQLARCALERSDAAGARASLERISAEAAAVGYAALVLEAGVYLAHAHARAGTPQLGLEALAAAAAAAGEEAALYGAAIDRARAACLEALGRPRPGARAARPGASPRRRRRACSTRSCSPAAPRARLSADPAEAAGEELREIDRLAQLLGLGESG